MEVQTRNFAGTTPTHETIAAAFKAAEKDQTIWKISWTDATTNERVRLVRDACDEDVSVRSTWVYEPIVLDKGEEQ